MITVVKIDLMKNYQNDIKLINDDLIELMEISEKDDLITLGSGLVIDQISYYRGKMIRLYEKMLSDSAELFSKINMYIDQVKSMMEEYDEYSEYNCKICYVNKIDCSFECGHTCCSVCLEKLNECHVCRSSIISIRKIYF